MDWTRVPHKPFVLLANEFLDALPIRQIIRRGETWHERFVQNGHFVEVPTDSLPLASSIDGELIFELNETAAAFVRAVGNRLSSDSGSALFLDYGPEHSAPGDSLQALRDGRPAGTACRSRHGRP